MEYLLQGHTLEEYDEQPRVALGKGCRQPVKRPLDSDTEVYFVLVLFETVWS